jgi:hypothetical protein
LAQWTWKIVLWSRVTSKWILVSVVCSIMKLFKFTFNKNLNFAHHLKLVSTYNCR